MAEFDLDDIDYYNADDCKEVLRRLVRGVFDLIKYAITKNPTDENEVLIFNFQSPSANLNRVLEDLDRYRYETKIMEAIDNITKENLWREGLIGSQLQTKIALVDDRWITAFPDFGSILKTRERGFIDTGPEIVPKGKVTIRVLFDYLKIPLSSLLDMLGVGKAISELADLLGLVVKRLNDEGGTPVRREGQNPVTVPVDEPVPV